MKLGVDLDETLVRVSSGTKAKALRPYQPRVSQYLIELHCKALSRIRKSTSML